MRLYLDCEFTRLSAAAKLISLALVAEDGREFYVELQDTWREADCSDFVNEIVLPQLWRGEYAMPLIKARSALLRFLATYDEELEIVTDAPVYDWELFCELAYHDGKWPKNVRNFPTDATTLTATTDGEELPHHALLDARIIASMFTARA
ncbi:3'-5' exoribonuclease [Pseudomonas syringae]|uniref:3'-5' exoribonuclease n=1 Tax=Pseudomonas syringae TaxID=317 RepID=UPI0018E6493B|nr:3'-5' exoribonuclease [Pseudomonas syringae]MBI6750945.1 3'-5' exoribonuclease [Pseudomonas syringae]MBI6769238.1 3'-5' exoribonuclease [Pseudomonas syringae]MBI6778557.1 3'-5' exoribonuclease [Pseudomonas syringae]MBI6793730.1 3'-5' exoribonuclease [Pseudomonas syringae]MBI6804461.1 3'-5' exoribonuclease [Pseudomonas syringae]